MNDSASRKHHIAIHHHSRSFVFSSRVHELYTRMSPTSKMTLHATATGPQHLHIPTPSPQQSPLEECVHHADIALCEANNGMSMALLSQSVYIVFLACFFGTRCGQDVWTSLFLFLYTAVALRLTIVVCCNFSSKSVAQDIMWCSTVRNEGVKPWSWIEHCQDATSALRLLLGTSVVIQAGLFVVCFGVLYQRRYLHRVAMFLRHTCRCWLWCRCLRRSSVSRRGVYGITQNTTAVTVVHDQNHLELV